MASAATASLVADYRFDGNFQSSVAELTTPSPPGATSRSGRRRSPDVAAGGVVSAGQGVAMHAKDLVGSGSYTIIMQARFETVPPDGYVRAINCSRRLYHQRSLPASGLDFTRRQRRGVRSRGSTPVGPNQLLVELALSRDAGSKLITGYATGFRNSPHDGVRPGGHPLVGNVYFFVDNRASRSPPE